jgi:hypothetical protein
MVHRGLLGRLERKELPVAQGLWARPARKEFKASRVQPGLPVLEF